MLAPVVVPAEILFLLALLPAQPTVLVEVPGRPKLSLVGVFRCLGWNRRGWLLWSPAFVTVDQVRVRLVIVAE
jgi:hypothetical protein